MGGSLSYLEKRGKMRLDIAGAFSERTSISGRDFLRVFYDAVPPPPIGDFCTQYIADDIALDEIFSALGVRLGLDAARIESHYHREESFPQFGEHLLRSGAYL